MIMIAASQLRASLADREHYIVPFPLARPCLRYIPSFFFNEKYAMGHAIGNDTRIFPRARARARARKLALLNATSNGANDAARSPACTFRYWYAGLCTIFLSLEIAWTDSLSWSVFLSVLHREVQVKLFALNAYVTGFVIPLNSRGFKYSWRKKKKTGFIYIIYLFVFITSVVSN